MTPRTLDPGGEAECDAMPQLDLRVCRRDGGEEGDGDERRRVAKNRWSEPEAGDERTRLDPIGFRLGANQWQGAACRRRGSEEGKAPTSRLQAQMFDNDEEGSRERRRCRGPHLRLWQRPRQQQQCKFL
jgi:hypothetical protein